MNKEGQLCRSLFAKNSLHPSFFSEYGTGETQGQTLRLDVFIRSLRTGGGGAGWFRHGTELEVALCLDHWEDHSWDTLIWEVFTWEPVKTFHLGIFISYKDAFTNTVMVYELKVTQSISCALIYSPLCQMTSSQWHQISLVIFPVTKRQKRYTPPSVFAFKIKKGEKNPCRLFLLFCKDITTHIYIPYANACSCVDLSVCVCTKCVYCKVTVDWGHRFPGQIKPLPQQEPPILLDTNTGCPWWTRCYYLASQPAREKKTWRGLNY